MAKGKNKMKKPTLQEIYDWSKGCYYTDNKTPWQPFEDYEEKELLEMVMSTAISLCDFLGIKYNKATDLDKCQEKRLKTK
jgi:hypothetical protein